MSRRSLIAGSVGALGVVGAGSIPALCAGKVYPGTDVEGIDISGMLRDDAAAFLRANLADLETKPLVFAFEGRSWRPSPADLGIAIDYASTLDKAMATGREGGVTGRYRAFLSLDDDQNVNLAFQIDDAVLDAYIAHVASAIDIAPREATLVAQDNEIAITDEAEGRALDRDHARDEAIRVVRSGHRGTVTLTTTAVAAGLTAAELEPAMEAAWRLIGEPVVFTYRDVKYPVGTEQLASALVIGSDNASSLRIENLQSRIETIGQDVATPARNVMLGWDNGLYVVEEDADGVEADLEAMGDLIQQAARESARTVELPVRSVRAQARVDNIDTLGISSHLGSGSSSFVGSSTARAENVRVSAGNISYKLVAPGEAFSFNSLLGPITEDYGYVTGTIIQGDWVASDIGGGVCQVSTTVFRAAVNAGFRFSEWNPHSWRLAFYEADGTPPGLDAAIYQPNTEWEMEQDLTFENPLNSWLLLMMVIDGDTVSAHFYSADLGWSVELFPARISEPKPVGEPIERFNESLAPGERRLVQQAQPGCTVWIRRAMTDAEGTVLSDGDFVSDYVSQPEAWEVGPE